MAKLKIDAPCKGCEKRHENCHKECARYLVFKYRLKKAQQENDARRQENDAFYDALRRKWMMTYNKNIRYK